MPAHTASHPDTVIVIGASIAGLLAARVASRYASRVLVIDRDRLDDAEGPRGGVPQGRHVHGLLARGLDALERLFPGFAADLDAAGAPHVEWMQQTRQRLPTGWMPVYPSGIVSRPITRPALERLIRARVAALPNVELRPRTEAVGLRVEDGRVTGVHVHGRGSPPGGGPPLHETLACSLAIVAGGRALPAESWLHALGCPPPPVTVIDPLLTYASRAYTLAPEHQPDWRAVLVLTRPDQPIGGVFTQVEGGKWLFTLATVGQKTPPTDEAAFAAAAARFPAPEFQRVFAHAVPASPIAGYTRTQNRFTHYERVALPGGVFFLGDVVCAFNPVYGQGMTAAVLAAETLDRALDAAYDDTAEGESGRFSAAATRRFQRRLARALGDLWWMATSEDRRYPHTRDGAGVVIGGRFTPIEGAQNRWLDWIFRAAVREQAAAQALLETLHVLRSPYGLLTPAVAWAVLKTALFPPAPPPADAPTWTPPKRKAAR
jgi:2-polyprenyl-6-methoxyphenol hydroxylase-like FAD-dependent oxidoreductase